MTLQLLTNAIPTKQKQAEAVNMLQSWLDTGRLSICQLQHLQCAKP